MIPLTKALMLPAAAPDWRWQLKSTSEPWFRTAAIGICSHSGAEYGIVCPQGKSFTTRANSEPIRLASYDARLIAAAASPGIPQAEL